jgi:hypothetical protein
MSGILCFPPVSSVTRQWRGVEERKRNSRGSMGSFDEDASVHGKMESVCGINAGVCCLAAGT